jgi:hypothetical protein
MPTQPCPVHAVAATPLLPRNADRFHVLVDTKALEMYLEDADEECKAASNLQANPSIGGQPAERRQKAPCSMLASRNGDMHDIVFERAKEAIRNR